MTTHTAIETLYRGATFRSRLEARWAAFFDLLGFDWVYEPWDGNHYIPDFILLGARQVLAEVKPGTDLHSLERHVDHVEAGIRGHWDGDYVLLGAAPVLEPNIMAAGILGDSYLHPAEPLDGQPDWTFGLGIWVTCTLCNATRLVSWDCGPLPGMLRPLHELHRQRSP
jgi:hypothetical protein